MLPTRIAALSAAFLVLTVFQAQALPRSQAQNTIICNQQGCSDRPLAGQASVQTAPGDRRGRFSHRRAVAASEGVSFLPHPAGCPRRAFCACGASVEVFGRSIRALWPSTAWFKYPRSAPGYKMVAVKRGHVFVLISRVQGNNWLVNDYNSGGHQSRRHVRNITGWTIVNPNGSMASN